MKDCKSRSLGTFSDEEKFKLAKNSDTVYSVERHEGKFVYFSSTSSHRTYKAPRGTEVYPVTEESESPMVRG